MCFDLYINGSEWADGVRVYVYYYPLEVGCMYICLIKAVSGIN